MKFLATLLLVSLSLLGQTKPTPGKSAFDKATLESYLRYSELWIPQVTVKIDDPKPSTAINGFSDVWVHLAYSGQTKDELYYVSPDGKNIVRGSAFHIEKSPFQPFMEILNEDKQPSFGAGANALVNLVVFGDFQCPVCQKENTELRKNLPAAFGDKVRVYFNDFPLTSIHPWAMKASIYGRCAYRQSQETFWSYHDWIYQNQQSITVENLDAKVQEFAKESKVDGAKLTACSTDNTAIDEVNRNIIMGHSLSVSATPTLFINGRKIEGAMDWPVLTQLLQIEADHATEAAKAASAAAPAVKAVAKADDSCCVVEVPKLGGKK
jgi:protein-disulfide isomerase